MQKLSNFINLIKFVLLIIVSLIVGYNQSLLYIVGSQIELLLIFYLSIAVAQKHPAFAYWLNAILCLLYVLQQGVWLFCGEYINMIMLENVNMLSNLGSMLSTYIIVAVIGVTISFLPFKITRYPIHFRILYISIFAYIFIAGTICYFRHSPFTPYTAIGQLAGKTISNTIYKIRSHFMDKQHILTYFHNHDIKPSGHPITQQIVERPNVILIFTEGMSAEVLDVYNELHLDLTPNLDSLYSRSLVFDNYYNHTAATFRGLRGQLYSSYQFLGGYYGDGTGFAEMPADSLRKKINTKIISLIDILNRCGYHTNFVNVEGDNRCVIDYLRTFHCDRLISDANNRVLSDREAIDLLWYSIQEMEEPYFMGFYNLGTHHGCDSPDIKYGDGNDAVLNRFYNYDVQIGRLIDSLETHAILDNTLFVFTTDHASFQSREYKESLHSKQQFFVNRIPLFICGAGIEPGVIDVKGRNSLGLAPTLLDLLGICKHENYFCGTSLLGNDPKQLEYYSALGSDFYRTSSMGVESVTKQNREISEIKSYYITCWRN